MSATAPPTVAEPTAVEGVEKRERPPLTPLREFRLAIVMYGGVSLSIYMNGVAQELFHLVRATASAGPRDDAAPKAFAEDEIVGSEVAYRRLAQSIPMGEASGPYGLIDTLRLGANDPILARFVVDVLSGSSAGGINAVFLAKALANDQKMRGLTNLWLDEGDIEKLLNDKAAASGMRREKPPESLLNSSRMYLKLLRAFDEMEDSNETGDTPPFSPYVNELDLFVTTTDLHGLELPIRFANGATIEPRYRNVFHFLYQSERLDPHSDFLYDIDPFLAFACRCTSAFPIAFKPMMLSDVDTLVASFSRYAKLRSDNEKWKAFYQEYLPSPGGGPAPGSLAFKDRPFADGGALDNKPFGYAIETLMRRHSDSLPVDRKLIFVEPDPSTRTTANEAKERPDVLENLLAQSLLLPRQEVVRDDLRRIDDLNRVIRRTSAAIETVEAVLFPEEEPRVLSVDEPRQQTVARHNPLEEGPSRGAEYEGYLSLRVESTIEELALLFCGLLRVQASSDYAVAIRALLKAWREGLPGNDSRSRSWRPPSFLKVFDIGYRLRRLAFVERRLDVLYGLEPTPQGAQGLLDRSGIRYWPEGDEADESFRPAIQRIRLGVAAARRDILGTVDRLTAERDVVVASSGLHADDLARIYEHPTDQGRRRQAQDEYRMHVGSLGSLMGRIGAARGAAFARASDDINAGLQAASSLDSAGIHAAAAFSVGYDHFDRLDAVAFPIQYGSEAGEGDEIEVIRISPLDARALTPATGDGGKVTGAAYMHFGAFLNRLWRANDIMWGRLDAAEVLIESLTPHPVLDTNDHDVAKEARDYRAAYVGHIRDMAHCSILREELKREDLAMLLQASKHKEKCPVANPRLAALLDTAGRCSALLEEFRDSYERPSELEPESTYRTIGRGAHILGQMFREVSLKRGVRKLGAVFATVARAGQFFTGMVEAAVPGSFVHLFWYHWFILLYLFEAIATLSGTVFGLHSLAQFGTVAFLVTVGVNLGIWFIARRLREPHRLRVRLLAIGMILGWVLFVGILVLAVLELLHLGRVYPRIPIFGHSPSPTPSK